MRSIRRWMLMSAAVMAGGAAPSQGPVTGPVADYWVSASTSSGFGAGLMAGGRPSLGSIVGLVTGRGPKFSRSLELVLYSTATATGAPAADHFTPPGLGVGESLPLVTPQAAKVTRSEPKEREPSSPESYQRPRGKILIYWGCGERPGPGQPVVFDFSTILTGAPLPDLGGAIRVAHERPPVQGGSGTYGKWPNEKKRVAVPATGSLVGTHDVRSDYAPEIHFDVPPEVDFMPPLDLVNAGPTSEGGQRLTWRRAPTATGYHLMLIGAQGSRGDPSAEGATMVFWSSSAVKPGFFGGGLADYLAPSEVARLVRARAVLSPDVNECIVPSVVTQAAPAGLVSAIGYGPEEVWSDPPRPRLGPWAINWRAKVRVKTTATLLLSASAAGPGAPGQPSQAPPPSSPGDAARALLRRLSPS